MEIGSAWWSFKGDDAQLRADLQKTEGLVTGTGTRAGIAGGQGISKGLGAGARAGGAAVVGETNATAGKMTGIFGTASGKISGNLKSQVGGAVGALGAAFAASQIISFLGNATNAAAEFEDSVAATGVIFGKEATPQMEAWGEAAAKNFGASKQEALSAANVIATLGKSAGLVGKDLVGFSQEMVGLGGDLASMFGGTTQDAITAVGAALRGESEPIRRYGVLLDDATLRAKAFEMGIIDTVKNALTPQQRVLAAQASIMEQTSDAQGDFLRTSDGMANSQRELGAMLENVNIEIGQKMIPVMLELVTFVKDTGIPAIYGMMDALGEVADGWNKAFGDADGGPAEWRQRVLDGVSGTRTEVLAIMEEFGIGYLEAHARLQAADEATAGGHEAAMARIMAGYRPLSEAQWDAVVESGLAWEAYQNQISGNVDAATTTTEQGADDQAAALGEMPEKAADKLLDNQFHLTDATSELLRFMDKALTPAKEMFNARMFLASQAAAAGLADGNPLVVQKTQEMINDANAVLASASGSALGYGKAWSSNFSFGITEDAWKAQSAAAGVAQAIRGIMPSSEPKDPSSPLRGITDAWGFNRVLAGGLSRVGPIRQAMVGVAAAMRPPTFAPSMAPVRFGVPAMGPMRYATPPAAMAAGVMGGPGASLAGSAPLTLHVTYAPHMPIGGVSPAQAHELGLLIGDGLVDVLKSRGILPGLPFNSNRVSY